MRVDPVDAKDAWKESAFAQTICIGGFTAPAAALQHMKLQAEQILRGDAGIERRRPSPRFAWLAFWGYELVCFWTGRRQGRPT
jgi:hypothetical protein